MLLAQKVPGAIPILLAEFDRGAETLSAPELYFGRKVGGLLVQPLYMRVATLCL